MEGLKPAQAAGRAVTTLESRKELIRDLWPDKTLQASLLLMLSAVASILFYVERAVFDIKFSDRVPPILTEGPSQTMAFFGLISGILAYMAIKRTHVGWGWAAAFFSAVSVGPLGLGLVCALAAAVFLVLAQVEREHAEPKTRALGRLDWPDKAIAAGLVLMLAGIVDLIWGVALGMGLVTVNLGTPIVLGAIAGLAGLGMLWASILSRREKAWGACMAASGVSIITCGLYVVGPLLGIAAVMLLLMAKNEDEFQ